MKYGAYSFSVLIETNYDSIYYGVGRHKSSEYLIPERFVNAVIKANSWVVESLDFEMKPKRCFT